MKKNLLTVLSIVMAFAMAFTAVGCNSLSQNPNRDSSITSGSSDGGSSDSGSGDSGSGDNSGDNSGSSDSGSGDNSGDNSGDSGSGDNSGDNGGDDDNEDEETEPKKVLLVSIDGLRPDALIKTEFGRTLMEISSYSLQAQTIYPSVTLPAHMSMFHGVKADVHGVVNNTYTPNANLGNGITETLTNAGKTCAMFYDWQEIQNVTSISNRVDMHYNSGSSSYETSTATSTTECIEHIQNTPTDFTFLYYGMTDSVGHKKNWMSNDYISAIHYVFDNLERVLNALPDDYVAIITADHGGGGDNGANDHGSKESVDMTIPFFIIGEDYQAGQQLSNVSILDIAPTVADLVGVDPESYWVGTSVASSNSGSLTSYLNAQELAMDIFKLKSSWGNYQYHGKVTSVETVQGGVKVGATNNGSTAYVGFKLTGSAIAHFVQLGFKYFTFTVGITAKSGTAPKYVDIYTYPFANDFFMTTPDTKDPNDCEYYYQNGREVTINIEALSNRLKDEEGLNFIFIKDGIWTSTGDAYLTFTNVSFAEGEAMTPEEKAFNLLTQKVSWGNYYNHGKLLSAETVESGVKISATKNSKTQFVGFKLNRRTVNSWVELGFKYFTFTMDISVTSGTTPKYVDVYTYPFANDFFMTTPDTKDPNGFEYYYSDGKEVTIDLIKLLNCLDGGGGLIFIFIKDEIWTPTGDASLTFSNVRFSA